MALPQVILGLHLPVTMVACVLAARRYAFAWGQLVAALLTGWVIWTLFEYAVHRWVLHHARRPWIRRIFWETFHKDHHAYRAMRDPAHHGIHVALTLPWSLALLGLVATVTTGGWALAMLSGWLFGYLSYETLHWLFHAQSPLRLIASFGPIARLGRVHAVHHLQHANMNYGFVTQFWDRQFGTAAMPDPRGGLDDGEAPAPPHTADAI